MCDIYAFYTAFLRTEQLSPCYLATDRSVYFLLFFSRDLKLFPERALDTIPGTSHHCWINLYLIDHVFRCVAVLTTISQL